MFQIHLLSVNFASMYQISYALQSACSSGIETIRLVSHFCERLPSTRTVYQLRGRLMLLGR